MMSSGDQSKGAGAGAEGDAELGPWENTSCRSVRELTGWGQAWGWGAS